MFNVGGATIRIKRFLLHESGSYNPQFRRPYSTSLDGVARNNILERLAGIKKYDPTMMGGIANQFISTSAVPESEIVIANGWGERRIRFVMELEYNSELGGSLGEMVLGYTNYSGVSINGAVDPNMEFYINSTMQTRATVEYTPMGNQTHIGVIDNSHILANNDWSSIYTSDKDQRMRPEDVYTTMTQSFLNSGNTGDVVLDTRVLSTNGIVKSRRSNSSASEYMAQILKGYTEATMKSNYVDSSEDIIDNARTLTRERPVGTDPFIAAISSIRGLSIPGNTFSFNDLRMLDPNIDNVTRAQLLAPTQKVSLHQTGQTAGWQGSDIETHIATILSQSVPSILMDLGLTRIVFKATNRSMGSNTTIAIIDAQGFINKDISRELDIFQIRLDHEILKDVTHENAIDYALDMRVDLVGETWLSLSLNSGPFIDYATPSFCDALLVPVLTKDPHRAMTLASDFQTLATSLIDNNLHRTVSDNLGGWMPGSL